MEIPKPFKFLSNKLINLNISIFNMYERLKDPRFMALLIKESHSLDAQIIFAN